MPRGKTVSDDNLLETILAKSMGGILPPLPRTELEAALKARAREFNEAAHDTFPKALELLEKQESKPPVSVELRGVFRFAHRLDRIERWQEQENLCTEARERLLAGVNFDVVAATMSQGATKELGGKLGLRFLDPLDPVDKVLGQLPTGAVSPVFEVDNGFWCYRIDKKNIGKNMPFAAMPWRAKRILLRKILYEIMDENDPR